MPERLLHCGRAVLAAKTAKSLGEDGKVAIRNIRKSTLDKIKKMKKAIGEDAVKDAEENTQKAVKKYEDEIVKLVDTREKEIMTGAFTTQPSLANNLHLRWSVCRAVLSLLQSECDAVILRFANSIAHASPIPSPAGCVEKPGSIEKRDHALQCHAIAQGFREGVHAACTRAHGSHVWQVASRLSAHPRPCCVMGMCVYRRLNITLPSNNRTVYLTHESREASSSCPYAA